MATPSRFDRNYELTVQVTPALAVVVKPPVRVVFSADKSVAGALNRLTARIYNLNDAHRLALSKDAEDGLKLISIELRVGYADTLQRVFKGTVFKGANIREGSDRVTVLDCLDGGFDVLNSYTSVTVKPGGDIIDAILAAMENTNRGKVTPQTPLLRPKVLVGPSAKLLDETAGPKGWYIDDEKLYVIRDGEVVSNFAPVVSAETGLVNTPTREQRRLTFETLLNPMLRIGGLCEVRSVMASQFNGLYRIDTINYDGDTHGADWVQTVSGFLTEEYTVL